MKIEKPPYTIAPEILFRIEEIGEAIGRATGIVQERQRTPGTALADLDSDPLETPVRPHPRRKSGACPTRRLRPSHPAEFNRRREHTIHCVHAEDHSGCTSDTHSKRPSKRPSSAATCGLADRFKNGRRTDGGTGVVASSHLPQKLPSPGIVRRASGNDAPRIAHREKSAVSPRRAWAEDVISERVFPRGL